MLQRLTSIPREAEKLLSGAGDSLEWFRLKESILDGRAALFFIEPCSYLVLHMRRPELYILGYAGIGANDTMKMCKAIAAANDCTHIRFQTARKGMPRLLKEHCPKEIYRVYTIQVATNAH